VISAAAQEDPHRFTTVLESLPAEINPVYTTHILLGLSQSATPEQSLRAAAAARTHTATSGVQIGNLIAKAAPHLDAALLTATGLTEDDLLQLLRQLLAQPPVPLVPEDAVAAGHGDAEPPTADTGEDPVLSPTETATTGQKIA